MNAVRLGCERLFDDAAHLIDGHRVGLITNHSGVDRTLTATADRLHAYPHSQLVALFGPEHGIRGAAQDGEKVGTFRDPQTGVAAHSLAIRANPIRRCWTASTSCSLIFKTSACAFTRISTR